MKYRTYVTALSVLLLFLLCSGFSWLKKQCAAPTPVPSSPGGYYQDAFLLELSAPTNGTIYYTTDGSTPTTASQVYLDGIFLQDRSQEPNIYNAVQNVVADWKDYTPDPTPVPKGTVVRALFVNDWGMESAVMTQTYFIGLQEPERGYTLSLIFEYDDLFGEEGIYVTGTEYDKWYLSNSPSSTPPLPNYEKELEVPAILELLDSSDKVLTQPIGVKIQGGTARAERKKRLTLTAREEYSGSQVFDTNLFTGRSTHSVMLKSYLPDAIIGDLLKNRSVALQDSIPVKVYLNGEYWYDSYMLERYDSHYFRQHYQVDERLIVKHGVVDEEAATFSEGAPYAEYMNWIATTDFSDESQWIQLQSETDVQSYIDYIVANYYFCNIDFGDEHNYVLWRSMHSGDSDYEDLRWRWCIYDIDVLEWINNDPKYGDPAAINVFRNDFSFDIQRTTLFPALYQNPAFRQQFVLSFMDIVNNNFAVEKVASVLEKHGLTIDWMDGFFLKRPAYAVRHLAEEFHLTGDLENVTVSVRNPEMGTIHLNTSQIDLSSGHWTGKYFTDYPVTITATANDGYTFLGWKGDANGTENSITISVEGGINLEAEFAKIK